MWYWCCLDSRYHRYWCNYLDITIIDDVFRSFVFFLEFWLVFMIFQGIFLIPDRINPTSHKCGEVCYFFVLSHGWLACVPHEQQCFTNQFVHSHLVPQINRVPHQQQCHWGEVERYKNLLTSKVSQESRLLSPFTIPCEGLLVRDWGSQFENNNLTVIDNNESIWTIPWSSNLISTAGALVVATV